MMQSIPSGVWTRLDGYEAEIFQDTGANIAVEVADGRIAAMEWSTAEPPTPPPAPLLRPPGGVWTDGYRVPIAGTWVHGDWAMGGGPAIVMDSGQPITFDTDDAMTVEWQG